MLLCHVSKPPAARDFSSSIRVVDGAPMLVYLMMSQDSVPSRVCEPPGRPTARIGHSTQVQMAGGGASPTTQVEPAAAVEHAPLWHIILLDDDDHTYEYVIEMLGKLFGYSYEKAMALAKEVDANGRVIVETTYLERAEFKRDQIHAYGRDWRITRSKGSMSAILEPAA